MKVRNAGGIMTVIEMSPKELLRDLGTTLAEDVERYGMAAADEARAGHPGLAYAWARSAAHLARVMSELKRG